MGHYGDMASWQMRGILTNLTDKECFKRTRSVIPLQALSVPVPELQAVFQFPTFILVIIWLSGVPVFISYRLASGHPEELPLLCLVSTTCPEVLMTKTQALNMLLNLLLLLLSINTGEMHSVVATVLGRSRPVSLEEDAEVVFFYPKCCQGH